MPDAVHRNPDWEGDERVIELSSILRRMSLHPPEKRLSSFRNEDGVSRKTHNLASSAPDWGKWRSNSSERDQEVMGQFRAAPDVMHRIAQDLLQDALNDTPETVPKFQE